MKEMIIAQLQERIGLSEEQAKGAADVVAEILEKYGIDDIKEKLGDLGGVSDALSGLMGKK